MDRFGVGNGAVAALRGDAGRFDGHSRCISSSAIAAADAAAAVARAAAARTGEVTMSAVTVYKAHGPVQHGLSRIMPTIKTTAGTVPHAGTGTVPREVVPDW